MHSDDAAKPPCPACQTQDSKVLETRWRDGPGVTYRRRECRACGRRYTTVEVVVEANSAVTLVWSRSTHVC